MKHWLQKLLPSRAPAPQASTTSAQERRQGNAHLDQGNLQAAINCYQRAATLDPQSADAFISLGFALQQAGQLHASLAALAKARQLQPQNFDAAYLSGQVCASLQQHAEAARHFEQALAQQPTFEPLYGELCQVLFQAGTLDSARSTINLGLQRYPQNAAFHLFSGNLHFHLQEWDAARSAYTHALHLNPRLPQAYGNLGVILQNQENWQQALDYFDKALSLEQREASFHVGRASCLFRLGQVEAALQSQLHALSITPDAADVHQNLGFLFLQLNRRTDSERHSRKALELNPNDANAHSNLGALQASLGHFVEAERGFQAACDLQPSTAVFRSNLGGCLVRQGRLPEAIACFRQAMQLDPRHVESGNNLLLALSADPATPAAQYLAEARAFGAQLSAMADTAYSEWPASANLAANQPLRVGLISSDLCNGVVGYFLEGVVAHTNPSRIQLVAYDTGTQTDALSQRMQPRFAQWNMVFGKAPQDIAQRIHGDGIHILVDLNGHAGGNSLPVFALKPAPVQISWLGYWASTGLPSMDFVLADTASVPPGEQNQFTEAVYYMPHTRHCFTPPHSTFPLSPTPALQQKFITFGSYQSLTKIHAAVLSTWGRVLQAVPHSRLHLTSHQVSDDAFQQQFRAKLEGAGIDASRVTLAGPLPRQQYLESYTYIDIVLDTFPYTGGTTTCEALWMGVPTLTLRGHSMIARQGVSMLGCVGLNDWIAEDEEDYVAKACAHAADIEALNTLRLSLRDRALASALFDAPRFAKDWEDALLAMWKIKQG